MTSVSAPDLGGDGCFRSGLIETSHRRHSGFDLRRLGKLRLDRGREDAGPKGLGQIQQVARSCPSVRRTFCGEIVPITARPYLGS